MNGGRATLLSDDQMRRLVADGFIVLDSGLDAGFHAAVADELGFAMRHEQPSLGDNVLPRVPALGELLESPVVQGAMSSLLGAEFSWLPHRFTHNSEPIGEPTAGGSGAFDPFDNGPRMGAGSISGSGWHQDGHSRAGRARWHTFRAANLFYFPHDVPRAMGPTRLLAGSHLYANLHGIVPEQVVMQDMPAGSLVLADFDLGHAGAPNFTSRSRYMVKFVAVRERNPQTPSWNHQDAAWRTPRHLATPHDLPRAWASLWNWLRGAPRNEGIAAPAAGELPRLMVALRTANQGQRLAALYDLIALGAPAVGVLAEALLATAGQDRHISPPPNDLRFYGASKDPLERCFSHRQCTPEDCAVALGAIGGPAVDTLAELLSHDDPWIRLNAAYALGEAGSAGAGHLADQVGELLDEPHDAVVRTAIDALCSLTTFGSATVARLHRLLTEDVAGWDAPAMGTHWTIQNQVRYAACLALAARVASGNAPAQVEQALIVALNDDTGYVPAVACRGLERVGTATALRAALRYLQSRRWDTVHHRFARERIEAQASA